MSRQHLPYRELLLCLLTLLSMESAAGAAILGAVRVTDVTARSFSVIWTADEAASGTLDVYDDSEGLRETETAVIDSQPINCDASLQTRSEDLGILKVRVTGLAADTVYYFRTRTTQTAGTTIHPPPDQPPMAVRTEVAVNPATAAGLPLHNDIMISGWTMADGSTPADATLVLAAVTGASYPITAFVGDCTPPGEALLDLNNLFDRRTGRTLETVGGVTLSLVNFRGVDGVSQVVHTIPANDASLAIRPPASGLRPGWNMFSVQIPPQASAVSAVMAPIADDFVSLWQPAPPGGKEEWLFYSSGIPAVLNSLDTIVDGQGYWLQLQGSAAPQSLVIHGTQDAVAAAPQPLHPGWNLVGARDIEAVPVTEAIEGFIDSVISIWTVNPDAAEGWDFYRKNGPDTLNRLRYIEPGKAYWLELDASCDGNPNCIW